MAMIALFRLVLGFVTAPLAAAACLPLVWCLLEASELSACLATSGGVILLSMWVAALCGFPPLVVLGIPLMVLMRREGHLRALPLAFLGACIAIVAMGLFILVEERWTVAALTHWIPFSMKSGIAALGAVAGFLFWAIAVYRNDGLGLRKNPGC